MDDGRAIRFQEGLNQVEELTEVVVAHVLKHTNTYHLIELAVTIWPLLYIVDC